MIAYQLKIDNKRAKDEEQTRIDLGNEVLKKKSL
jgi:hypothetical protein